MQIEREKYLGVKLYERSENRQGHANGYKPKTVKTRVGEVTFGIPQVREGGFYPNALEKGIRSERILLLTLAEVCARCVHPQSGSHHRKIMRNADQCQSGQPGSSNVR